MLKILKSVGQGGVNQKQDVLLVQMLLNRQSIPGVVAQLKEDGIIGKNTIGRIKIFQKTIVKMLNPDGRIDPDGKSFKMLSKSAARPGTKVASALSFGVKGFTLLKSIEELALKPYDDQTGLEITNWVEGATIGYGHLILKPEWDKYKNGITEAQSDTLLNTDLSPFVEAVKSEVTSSLIQNEFDALVLFVFNIGKAGFASSSVLKLINNPAATTAYPNLEAAWKAWNKSQGKVMQGLKNRRQAEWDIYSKNIYKKW